MLSLSLIIEDDFLHKGVVELKRFLLEGVQLGLAGWHFEHDCGDHESEHIVQVFLTLFGIKLMHNVKLQIELLSVNGVLTGIVEVELESSRGKLIQLRVLGAVSFEELKHFSCEEIFVLVKAHLVGHAIPEVAVHVIHVRLVFVFVSRVVKVDLHELFGPRTGIEFFEYISAAEESNRSLFIAEVCDLPFLVLAPVFSVRLIVKGN